MNGQIPLTKAINYLSEESDKDKKLEDMWESIENETRKRVNYKIHYKRGGSNRCLKHIKV